MHSDVIGNFVDTYEWPTGQIALKTLFQVADKDGNGIIDEKELMDAFKALGFTWLQEKQIQGILKRADNDENGVIDMEEFMREAPKTLRTNLVKLAKKNGGDLGFLV
jgi:Ca2+-binding EF-hand superfamily protein